MSERVFKSEAGHARILQAYDLVLSLWRAPYVQQMISTRHGQTAVITCGDPDAPPLVLLHGSASNSTLWLSDAAAYATHYRVICPDLPGEPGRSQPVRFRLDGPAPVEWLEDVLDAVGVAHTRLLGISLGGWLALKFAAIKPRRVVRLVALCPSGVAPPRVSFMLKVLPLSLLGPWGADRIMTLLNNGRPLAPDLLGYLRVINQNFSPRLSPPPLFTDAELRGLTMPVLVIAGAHDVMLDSQTTLRRLQALLPAATCELLPEAGHLLINQSERVMQFLSSSA